MKRPSKSSLLGSAILLLGACSSSAVGQPPVDENLQIDAIWPVPGAPPSDTPTDDKNNPWLMDLIGGAANTLPPTSIQDEREESDDPQFDAGHSLSNTGGTSSGTKVPIDDGAERRHQPLDAPPEAGPGPNDVVAPSVLFRRYREGEGADKLLEIQNVGEGDAASCVITVYSNGNAKPWRTLALPTLPAQTSVVLCTDKVEDEDCTDPMSGSPFNGNDALLLSCGSRVMDSFGQVGFDPGLGWLSASRPELRTYDAELLRCGLVADPDPSNEFVLEPHWVPLPAEGPLEQAENACEQQSAGLGGAPS